jgi:hypothetical protein
VRGRNHVTFFPTILSGSGFHSFNEGGNIGSDNPDSAAIESCCCCCCCSISPIFTAKFLSQTHGFPVEGHTNSDDANDDEDENEGEDEDEVVLVSWCVAFNSRVVGHSL